LDKKKKKKKRKKKKKKKKKITDEKTLYRLCATYSSQSKT